MRKGIALVALALASFARAEEVAIPLDKQPQRVEPAPRAVPQRMLVPEARILFDLLRAQAAAPAPAEEAAAAPDPGTRTFDVPAPAAGSAGAGFVFEDVTDRSGTPGAAPPAAVLTIDQRRAAVEAFRRAVARRRAAE